MGRRGNGNPFLNVEDKDLSFLFNSGQRTDNLGLLEAKVWNNLLALGELS